MTRHGHCVIDLVDGGSLHDALTHLSADEQPLLYLWISRSEIETMNIGSAVDRLMTMSDTRANTVRLKNALHIAIDGFNGDTRELYEIPSVLGYFRAVAGQWNGWLHYVDASDDTLPLVLRLLTDVKRVGASRGIVNAHFVDAIHPAQTVRHLFAGLNALYESYGFGDPAISTRSAEVAGTIDRMFAE